jgi:hypothetical protein
MSPNIKKKHSVLCLAICILTLSFGSIERVCAAVPGTERDALIALYNTTYGDNWFKNSGWKTPPLHTDGFALPGTECSWAGISCSDGDTHVDGISMVNNNLIGAVQADLASLVYSPIYFVPEV